MDQCSRPVEPDRAGCLPRRPAGGEWVDAGVVVPLRVPPQEGAGPIGAAAAARARMAWRGCDRRVQASRGGRRVGQARRQGAGQPRGRPVRPRGGAPVRRARDAGQGGLRMKDPMKMLRQVQQMQDRMAKVQTELESETVEASVGGGAVRVVATGTPKVVSVVVDPEAATETEMLQDLVVAAVNEAMEASKQLAAKKMQAVAGGLGLPPGLI